VYNKKWENLRVKFVIMISLGLSGLYKCLKASGAKVKLGIEPIRAWASAFKEAIMGKVIKFVSKREAEDSLSAEKLVAFSNEIDDVVIKHIDSGSDPRELAGILAHRLGTFMGQLTDKDELWDFCERVVRRQADLESV